MLLSKYLIFHCDKIRIIDDVFGFVGLRKLVLVSIWYSWWKIHRMQLPEILKDSQRGKSHRWCQRKSLGFIRLTHLVYLAKRVPEIVCYSRAKWIYWHPIWHISLLRMWRYWTKYQINM